MKNKIAFRGRSGGSRTFANDGERIIADIVQAIVEIPESEYTTSGKPRVEDIELLLNENISEGQRDQAFSEYEVETAESEPEPEEKSDD